MQKAPFHHFSAPTKTGTQCGMFLMPWCSVATIRLESQQITVLNCELALEGVAVDHIVYTVPDSVCLQHLIGMTSQYLTAVAFY